MLSHNWLVMAMTPYGQTFTLGPERAMSAMRGVTTDEELEEADARRAEDTPGTRRAEVTAAPGPERRNPAPRVRRIPKSFVLDHERNTTYVLKDGTFAVAVIRRCVSVRKAPHTGLTKPTLFQTTEKDPWAAGGRKSGANRLVRHPWKSRPENAISTCGKSTDTRTTPWRCSCKMLFAYSDLKVRCP